MGEPATLTIDGGSVMIFDALEDPIHLRTCGPQVHKTSPAFKSIPVGGLSLIHVVEEKLLRIPNAEICLILLMMIMSFICSCRNKISPTLYTPRVIPTIRGYLEGLA
jgi:hypothetical protein